MSNKIQKLLRKTWVSILLSVVIGFGVGAIALAIAGHNPFRAYSYLFQGIFSQPRHVAWTIINATPIILTALSVVFAYKTGLFNIGADGQFMMGAVAAVFLGHYLHLPPIIHPIVVILGAMLVAGIYGGIVGLLKAKFGINEVITSIMLNWVALYFNNYYITLPGVRKPNTDASWEIQQTAYIRVMNNVKFADDGVERLRAGNWFFSDVVLRTDLNYGILIAIAACVLVWFILNKTTLGYSLKAVGFNKDAAEFAGINVKKNIITSMFIAGAIAGIAGAVFIMGQAPHRVTTLAFSEQYGFHGLSVALIGAVHPIGIIFAGLFFGGIRYGSGSMQARMGVPNEIISIVIGSIVFFISIASLFRIIADRIEKKKGGK